MLAYTGEKVLIDYFVVPKILPTFALIRLYVKAARRMSETCIRPSVLDDYRFPHNHI